MGEVIPPWKLLALWCGTRSSDLVEAAVSSAASADINYNCVCKYPVDCAVFVVVSLSGFAIFGRVFFSFLLRFFVFICPSDFPSQFRNCPSIRGGPIGGVRPVFTLSFFGT